MKTKTLIPILLSCLLLTGCVTRLGSFTVASTKNIDIKKSLHRVDERVRVKDRDTRHIILFISTGMPNFEEAMDNAIEQKPGAVGLSNVSIKHGFWWIPLIYGKTFYEVEGNPVYEVE